MFPDMSTAQATFIGKSRIVVDLHETVEIYGRQLPSKGALNSAENIAKSGSSTLHLSDTSDSKTFVSMPS